MERLQKVMAHAGVASRRKSEEIIAEGRVKVNGEIVEEMGFKVDPEEDEIVVDGEVISEEKKRYILLNKPEGYITTVSDPEGRPTVMDLIPDLKQRLYPAGRLDYDSSGLLLMTNDGDLTYKLTHPKKEVDKKYRVLVQGKLSQEEFEKFEAGMIIDGQKTAPAKISNVNYKDEQTQFEIVIHEGRNRQVRRMVKIVGFSVISLKRIAFAFLTLKGVKEGEFRYLSDQEVNKLKNIL
ncbi:ribosomal large subunit pseudouridine synthase B [Halanaerobium saccharolyticum]|uniref:Pseudouridine synthase n=1 Tax=Halanaerobium saccharolyticum TaxID=43595 RepID=A0A4R7Z888_9FIRM|nr:pseudouridine synthase [Halanaerobium saccharolyticum]RAK11079.1 ribosomal large subunit pseudouridine synthase B [Halanaerobium saccharolyticum]TDW06930.1 ribosomal large subunit pseudouridine synthase B [Halanaerobium saccharolyticum]TDX63695.1 ribosomal large subunit pseudouridine synthase B [Halanaerobium saccharolyticum]